VFCFWVLGVGGTTQVKVGTTPTGGKMRGEKKNKGEEQTTAHKYGARGTWGVKQKNQRQTKTYSLFGLFCFVFQKTTPQSPWSMAREKGGEKGGWC